MNDIEGREVKVLEERIGRESFVYGSRGSHLRRRDEEEEQARENEGDVALGLRRVRQKVKDEDQRGQGWHLGNPLGAKWG